MTPATHVLTLPGPMLRRGFWLYVWRVETSTGDLHYVGRTGDNSSPHASAPYTRMGQHLGSVATQNALRKHLEKRGVPLESCTFHLISHGPLYNEVAKADDATRDADGGAHAAARHRRRHGKGSGQRSRQRRIRSAQHRQLQVAAGPSSMGTGKGGLYDAFSQARPRPRATLDNR